MQKNPSIWRRLYWLFNRTRKRVGIWLIGATADMYWDMEGSPDRQYYEPEEWANDEWGGAPGTSTVVKFSRAISLPDQTYKITAYAPDPETDDVEYRVEAVAADHAGP